MKKCIRVQYKYIYELDFCHIYSCKSVLKVFWLWAKFQWVYITGITKTNCEEFQKKIKFVLCNRTPNKVSCFFMIIFFNYKTFFKVFLEKVQKMCSLCRSQSQWVSVKSKTRKKFQELAMPFSVNSWHLQSTVIELFLFSEKVYQSLLAWSQIPVGIINRIFFKP